MFPQSYERGEICRVCDRKFHIREILKDKNLQIEAQTQQLLGKGGLNDQHEKSREELLKIQLDGKRQNQIYKLDNQNIKKVMEKTKEQLSAVKKHQDKILLESDRTLDHEKEFTQKGKTLETEKEGYNDELVYLAEEIEKMEDHIILTQQEHRKLDMEWKLYVLESEKQSMGKQPNQKDQKKNKKKSKKEKESILEESDEHTQPNFLETGKMSFTNDEYHKDSLVESQ